MTTYSSSFLFPKEAVNYLATDTNILPRRSALKSPIVASIAILRQNQISKPSNEYFYKDRLKFHAFQSAQPQEFLKNLRGSFNLAIFNNGEYFHLLTFLFVAQNTLTSKADSKLALVVQTNPF